MREDPIFSGGVVKLVLLVLVAAALGVGVYAVAGKGVHVDLPDLPDGGTGGVTQLENTDLSDTTLGGDTTPEPETADPFTSAAFGAALDKVREAAGPSAQATRLFINDVQTQFIVRRGDGVEAYSVRADSGELTREDATITISGSATIDDFSFSLAAIKASAVDPMLAAARKQSGAADFRPTVLSLERSIPFGSRKLEWTINAEGGGRNLVFRANSDGSDVHNVGGKGSPIPPAAQDAEKLNDCIQAAHNDPNKILDCLSETQN